MFDLNTVIYNPLLSKEFNKQIISSELEKHYRIHLPDSELDKLTKYDKNHLNAFIEHFRRILDEKSKYVMSK